MGVTHVRWALCVHLPLVLLVLLLPFLFFDGMITVPACEEVWSWVGSLRRSHHHRGDGRRIVTFVTLPSILLLLYSEYNTCHQGQVGNPCATTFVPRSKVLVPIWFQAQLTSSWVNSCWSGVTVAMTVTQATPWRGNALFPEPPWAPCEVQAQFYHSKPKKTTRPSA